MADKMMRIAGLYDDGINGKAKGLKTNSDGKLMITLSENIDEYTLEDIGISILPEEGKTYEFDMTDFQGYRVFISLEGDIADAHFSVRPLNYSWSTSAFIENSTYEKDELEFSFGRMKSGYASNYDNRVSGQVVWSDVIPASRKTQKIRIYNFADSIDISISRITIVKYKNVLNKINDSNESSINYQKSIVEYRRTTSIPPKTNFPALDSDKALTFDYPVTIERLEWQTNHRTMPRIMIDIKVNGVWIPSTRTIERDGSTSYIHTPQRIQELKTEMWEVLEFDNESTQRYFKFALRKPINAPEGLRIYIYNDSEATPYAGGIVVQGRRLE